MTFELRGALETSSLNDVSLVLTRGARPSIDREGGEYFYGYCWSLSLSADSSVLVVGSTNNDYARTFDWDGTNYVKRGADLNTGFFDNFGWAVALTDDGEVLVVGEPGYDAVTNSEGRIRRYDRTGSTWTHDVDYDGIGVASSGRGAGLDISNDGGICVAAAYDDVVETYDWGGTSYSLRAGGTVTITSVHGSVYSYGTRDISLNSAGTRVSCIYRIAMTASPFYDLNLVSVYEWGGASWARVGAEIISPLGIDKETVVSHHLSDDGTRLFVMMNDSRDLGNGNGNLYVYDWVNPNWVLNTLDTDAYGPIAEWSALGDNAGLWVSADETVTAFLDTNNSDIDFFGYPVNELGDCIVKVLDESDVGVIGTYCIPVEPTNQVSTPPNVPIPPGVTSGPDNTCSYFEWVTWFTANSGNGPSSAIQDYEDWLLENYWAFQDAGGTCT